MADIIINEISQNYTYNIGANSFATVALPITASWGPGLVAVKPSDITDEKLEEVVWKHFPATQAGLESFVATYRGASALWRTAKDYSYQMAVSLLSAGYDVLVCRVSSGKAAIGECGGFSLSAKYVGTFGNNVKVVIKHIKEDIFNVIVYAVDISGVQTALENLLFTTNETKVSDSIVYIDEFESNFINVSGVSTLDVGSSDTAQLAGGTDFASAADATFENLWDWYADRYKAYADSSDIIAATASYPYDADNHFAMTAKLTGVFGNDEVAELVNGAKAVAQLSYTVNTIAGDTTTYTVDGLNVTAKYRGAYANNYTAVVTKTVADTDKYYLTLEIKQGETVLETKNFVDNAEWASDYPYIDDASASSNYATFEKFTSDPPQTTEPPLVTSDGFEGGADFTITISYRGNEEAFTFVVDEAAATASAPLISALNLADSEFITTLTAVSGGAATIPTSVEFSGGHGPSYADTEYGQAIWATRNIAPTASNFYKQAIYSMAYDVYYMLNDKLSYNFQRVISPGWDDQDITEFGGEFTMVPPISALHHKLMDVGFHSRCGTAFIDIPKALPRKFVYDASETTPGYAQKLSRAYANELENTHSALFAPWGQYVYAGTTKQATASPSFLALLINRAMIINQSIQYEWCLPTNRTHNLKLGKFDYAIPAHLLEEWQSSEGVGVNCLTSLPDLGNTIWGNSTLFEIPPATYQALENLSTRFLVNAVKDIVYRCGISITFQYNNGQAYDRFYAGVTPLLDTMKNVGAIEGYYVRMSQDIDSAGQINANTIIGAVYLVVAGVVTDLVVDLVALPPQTDISQFGE